jgi:hypothetical protein
VTDIVERLRELMTEDWPIHQAMHEAADEIERLRRQYDACRRLLDKHGILEDTRAKTLANAIMP